MARLWLAALALPAACTHGTRVADFPPARGPSGASVALRVTGERADRLGEIYASDTASVMLRTTSSLMRIPWTRIAAMDVAGLGLDYDVRWGETAPPAKHRRLAQVSRFPQGLRGDLLARVLALSALASVDEVP